MKAKSTLIMIMFFAIILAVTIVILTSCVPVWDPALEYDVTPEHEGEDYQGVEYSDEIEKQDE